ncbi:hypothetical protein BDZ85DRAFT_258379 [Elsinoe ampelina]|uniref:Zn(2)-C6 fungal-type domain-containing protein n=1 Tax=Elsinoe ampelina TaxID=302913 RepID=A0A6A6GK00_9PEZI|nr:hypothetical protein BDZ85DRAFT_258379 [Elsinoe ampelina]
MKRPRYALSRRKVCIPCKAAKSKCDRKAERCTRCVDRDLRCVYSITANNGQVQETASTMEGLGAMQIQHIDHDDSMREWQPKPLQINELWPLPADSSESEHRRQSERIEKWLEQVDEYCTMLYAVASSLHGV